MWMRYFLGAGGINPDRVITIPPAQMVANVRVGAMDGYCVGEPWNARAIVDEIGFTALNTQDLWRDHPEKVLAFTRAYAEANPKPPRTFSRPCTRRVSGSITWRTGRNRPTS
jgi:nitrate/nitrite transport system substrate-binding protein